MIPLRDIRRRIGSVRRISHITRAMKTVSAIRLMRVQSQVLKQKPYASKLRELVADLVQRTPANRHPMLSGVAANDDARMLHEESSTVNRKSALLPVVCLALGSDRGLCGPFNNNVLAESIRFRDQRSGRNVRLTAFGKKLVDLMHSRRVAMAGRQIGFYADMTYEKVTGLAAGYLKQYLAGEIAELWVVYTEFRSTARQRVKQEQILPIGQLASDDRQSSVVNRQSPLFPEYGYEPDPFTVLDRLLPMYYNREVWRVFLESAASEHMARMLAMDMATINAGEMISELTLSYNKARQESITRELSEISTAAEAFRNR